MKRQRLLLALTLFCGFLHFPARALPAASPSNWPQWRGPLATGAAPDATPPLEWSETKNVKWKVKTPGFGTATPIIWENRVFILTAIPTGKKSEARAAEKSPEKSENPNPGGRRGPGGPGGGFGAEPAPTEAYQFVVICLDRQNGKTLWQKVAREEVPHEGHHKDHGFASASPITDGKLLFAYFGSHGLFCYDLDGNLKWEKDFGDMQTRMGFGEGSSPALHGNTIVVLWDHEGDDFVIALDKNSGKELWRTKRDENTGWCTPLIVEHGGKAQVIINASNKVRSYDLADGKEVWNAPGTTANAIPSPVSNKDMVYVTGGFRGSALHAIRLGSSGNLEGTPAMVWSHNKSTPYVPTPLLTDDLLYFVSNNNGILSCFDAATGKPHFDAERVGDLRGIYASPVATKDRVYVLGRDGKCVVLKKGPKFETLATNTLSDNTDASIALAGKDLFIRGHESLYCISEK
jgi:outer membrane protein assembly factor BamB